MFLFLSLFPTAEAFCGTFVAAEGDITNGASEIAIAREGRRTTLTMANDFHGDASEFAMLVPVPEILNEDDVHVVDPAVFDRLRGFSQPRQVTYTCDELYPEPVREPMGCGDKDASDDTATSADTGSWADSGGGVTVEEQFIVGEYEIVVLSAEESGGLLTWLGNNGYAVSSDAEEMLQEYLEAGSFFFAAKVFTDRIPGGQAGLSPLRIGYDSDAMSLPIRLGTLNSGGSQDLIIYGLTTLDDGRLGISNYDEAEVEADCLLEGELASAYQDAFTDTLDGQPQWVVEHGWEMRTGSLHCDPCTEVPGLPQDDVVTLGFGDYDGAGDTGSWGWTDYYFTRVHIRYTPEQATEDLQLYGSGITENTQQRYIAYESFLEAEFPMCGTGWVEDNPGSCADEGREYRERMDETPNPSSGCAVGTERQGAFALLILVGGLLLRRRA